MHLSSVCHRWTPPPSAVAVVTKTERKVHHYYYYYYHNYSNNPTRFEQKPAFEGFFETKMCARSLTHYKNMKYSNLAELKENAKFTTLSRLLLIVFTTTTIKQTLLLKHTQTHTLEIAPQQIEKHTNTNTINRALKKYESAIRLRERKRLTLS